LVLLVEEDAVAGVVEDVYAVGGEEVVLGEVQFTPAS